METWKEIVPGTYNRPIGEGETFIELVSSPGRPSGRENWAINSTVTISPREELAPARLIPQLRRAWGHLRFHHPSIAAYVTDDNELITYKVPSPEELENWIEKTFTVAEDAADSAEVISTLKPGPYATLTYIPRSNELLGHTAHWRTDGTGAMLLLAHLLQLVVEPALPDPVSLPWGEEFRRLVPAVEDAGNMPLVPNEAQVAMSNSLVGTFAHFGGAVGIPYVGSDATPPQGTYSVTQRLPVAVTDAVKNQCKAQGLTVTSAVHASVAAANWKLATPDRKHEHFASTTRFSFRPYLPEPYSSPAYAAGFYSTGWTDRVESTQTWLEHAKHYNEVYQKGLSQEHLDSHRAFANGVGDMVRNAPPTIPIQSGVDISSIGLADLLLKQSYGQGDLAIDVLAMSIGVELITRQATCFVWTFRGQLNLHVVYNGAYHERSQMMDFVGAVKASLLEGLGIEGGQVSCA